MNSLGRLAIFVIVVFLALPAFAEDKAKQSDKPRNYAEAAEDCGKAIERRRNDLGNEYQSEVWSLRQRFQKEGDLEKSLAADKEWSRSIRGKALTPKDVVESPTELQQLQKDYIARFDGVVETVATEFLQDLRKEAAGLAKAGNLSDGKVLQQEIDTIKQLYLGGKDQKPLRSGKADGDAVTACEEAIRQKRVALQAKYVGELEALEKSFQAKGALEDLFATKGERDRFLNTPLLAEENFVETPDALQELQQKYLELQQNVTASVAQEFVARLEQQKQTLTIEGRLEEAVIAKNNAENISQRFLRQGTEVRPPKRAPNVAGTWNSNGSIFTITQRGDVLAWTSQDPQHTYTSECKWNGTHFVGTCERTIKGSGCMVPITLVLTLKSPREIFCEDTAMQTGCGLTRNQQHQSTWQKVQ
jgi:hypothetical protein